MICFLRGLWWSLKAGLAPIEGHDYRTHPDKTPKNVHVLQCQTCGHISMSWSWNSLEHLK